MKISFFPTGIRTVCPSSTPAVRREKKRGNVIVFILYYNLCVTGMPQLPRELPATAAAPAHHERRHNTDQRHREPLAMSPAPWQRSSTLWYPRGEPYRVLLRNASA